MYGVSSIPGVGGLTTLAGRRTIVPSDDDDEDDKIGFLLMTGCSKAAVAGLFLPFSSLFLIDLIGGIVASDCWASGIVGCMCIGGVSYLGVVVRSSLLEASEVSE